MGHYAHTHHFCRGCFTSFIGGGYPTKNYGPWCVEKFGRRVCGICHDKIRSRAAIANRRIIGLVRNSLGVKSARPHARVETAIKLCAVDGCGGAHKAVGLCAAHYQRRERRSLLRGLRGK